MNAIPHLDFSRGLEDGFLAALIAICAKVMRWLTSIHSGLYSISERPGIIALKFIPLLVCIPVFKASDLVFKLRYFAGQRRLRILCSKQARLGISHRPLEIELDLLSCNVCLNTVEGLKDITRRFEAAQSRCDLRQH